VEIKAIYAIQRECTLPMHRAMPRKTPHIGKFEESHYARKVTCNALVLFLAQPDMPFGWGWMPVGCGIQRGTVGIRGTIRRLALGGFEGLGRACKGSSYEGSIKKSSPFILTAYFSGLRPLRRCYGLRRLCGTSDW
jgi:hypothetical protein